MVSSASPSLISVARLINPIQPSVGFAPKARGAVRILAISGGYQLLKGDRRDEPGTEHEVHPGGGTNQG